MKKTLIISGIVFALIALGIFNKLTTKGKETNFYAEVKEGLFEITVSTSGELLAERSLDIRGPEIGQGNNRNRGRPDSAQADGYVGRVCQVVQRDAWNAVGGWSRKENSSSGPAGERSVL